ncbi:non-ribosomal peptide synthetase [Paenibacillus provencensis]|uniref:Non-ribosomal peptide synthetase n=2 Tax=Bacteria TaxID=2 RepID=A0ABW3PPQ4_9BACL|nr:non-ribosomal peptide synthetase [Paenibacillus sp. MER 78]MCM3126807.1 amino acid adenylation domain-containing protein [Paenibacillus sp. MER 78]
MMSKTEIADIYPLSPMQESLLFHSLYDQGDMYFEQMIFSLEGHVDEQALENSLNKVINRYDILRTVFVYDKINKPRQVVLKKRNIKIRLVDLTNIHETERNNHVSQLAIEDRRIGFDLSKGPLLRLTLIKTNINAYELIWSNHHILIDGWCLGLLFQEWFALYRGEISGEPVRLSRVIPYKRYIQWLEAKDASQAKTYWNKYLSGYEESSFPQERTPTNQDRSNIQESMFNLGLSLTDQLTAISRQYQVTMSSLFQAVWGVVLQYYSDSDDVVFGTIVSGRSTSIPDVDQIMGLFINAAPVRIQSSSETTFAELVKTTHENSVLAEEHSYLSLADVQAEAGGGSLFNHLLVYENYPANDSMFNTEELGLGFKIRSIEAYEHTNYDLNISIGPGTEIRIKMNYNEDMYSIRFIQRLFSHLKMVCTQIAGNPEIKVKDISVLTYQETEHLSYWNNTKADYPMDQTLVDLFAQQAAAEPHRTAVVMGNMQWTYRELNEISEKWSHLLRNKGVKPGDIVGLCSQRSCEMITAILAILKTGAAYLPLDPTFPSERLSYMMEDADVQQLVLLTDMDLPEFKGEIVTLTDLQLSENMSYAVESTVNLDPDYDAYVIYTSGSTGKPKGVTATHRNVIKTMINNGYIEIDKTDRLLQISNYAFDGATFDIYGALLNGAALVLISREEASNIESLGNAFSKYDISVAFMTTALFNTLVDWNPDVLTEVCHILFGGEKASARHINTALTVMGPGRLLHMYGPTETTVFATCHTITESGSTPIGKPIHNTTAFILNRDLKPMPVGVPGELYIGGDGLSKGYRNRPALTSERFIEHPFYAGKKLYKTGDIVRRNEDGSIEYLDRADYQVKIRGHRIELGEIESKLKDLSEVKDAIVKAFHDQQGHLYLCAYIVPVQDNYFLDIAKCREELKKSLPDYMLPAVFHRMESPFALNSNGKVDRSRLPEPNITSSTSVPLSGPTEDALADIWKEVLGIQQISALDHFFELGGHSLKAMMLTAKIHKVLGVKLSLHNVFQSPVLTDMARCIQMSQESQYMPILRAPVQETYPVSSAQKRVYIAQQLEKGQTNYNMPMILEIEGEFNRNRMESALRKLIERHESLRTSFVWIGETLRQKIIASKDVNWSMDYLEINDEDFAIYQSSGTAKKEWINQALDSFIRPFDLGNGPLIRAMVITLDKTHHLLFMDTHHIISDGVSTGIIYQDLARLYQSKSLPVLELHYKDFAVYEEEYRSSSSYEKNQKYWRDQFAAALPEGEISTDYARPSVRSAAGKTLSFHIEVDLLDQLKKVAAANEATLYMVLLAGYKILISRYSGTEDVVVGSPIAGRSHEDTHQMIGMFVNTLALRSQPKGRLRVHEWIREVKQQFMEAQAHGDYPLEDLLNDLNFSRDMSRHPLFDTLFVLQNMDIPPIELEHVAFRSAEWDWSQAKFDMTWGCRESSHGLDFIVEYAAFLYKEETIQRMIGHFMTILEQMVHAPDMLLMDINMLTEEEHTWLNLHNRRQADYPHEASIPCLFLQQAVESAELPALIHGSKVMTYNQLNEAAEHFTRVLISMGVNPGDRVGLLADRSMEMIIAIVGILKAGAAYVPLDPALPEHRIEYILKDSGARFVVSTSGNAYDQEGITHIAYSDLLSQGKVASELTRTTDRRSIAPEDIAYVMYTSGSTGQPKGVLTTHRNVVKISINNGFAELGKEDRMLQLSNYAFDGSTYEIFGALLNGASLHIITKDELLNAATLASIMEEQRITSAFMTTSLFNMMVDYDVTCFKHVNKLFFGGETASIQHVDKALDYLGEGRIFNAYGPTETTVFATTYPITNDLKQKSNVPIGRPIHNTSLYVRNAWGHEQPVGMPGELFIGGDGVAAGYLNNTSMTTERFIPNPQEQGKLMYRTGDLVRWSCEGELEYLGRMDGQVKVRGNRVETGEIESMLISNPAINQAVVVPVADTQGTVSLSAYVVCHESSIDKEAERILYSEWREWLKRRLPDYMIPSTFMIIEAIPLTTNGKVDRSKLPEPVLLSHMTNKEQPENNIEVQLQKFWSEVLGVEGPGMLEHFFDLGGHSLKAMQLSVKVQHEFGINLNLQDIFLYPTIREQASLIHRQETPSVKLTLPKAQAMEFYPVSSAQKRIYLASQYEHAGTSYNMPMLLRLEGKLDLRALNCAFQQLIMRHESLRTIFHLMGDEIKQQILPPGSVQWEIKKEETGSPLDDEAVQQWVSSQIKPFDLSSPYLIRAVVREQTLDHHLLFMDIHHIISDGVSTSIILNELFKLYSEVELPPLTIQYKDYAVWEEQYHRSEKYLAAKTYWTHMYKDEVPELNLPTSERRNLSQGLGGAKHSFYLDTELVSKMKNKIKEKDITLFMLLMAGYYVLLSKYAEQEKIVVGIPVAGRDVPEVEPVVGMFVQTLAIQSEPKADLSIDLYLDELKKTMLEAYKHADYPLEELIEELDVTRDSGRSPLFDTLFVLQNMNTAELLIEDVHIHQLEVPSSQSKFDMIWAGAEQDDVILMTVEYNQDIYSASFIRGLSSHYRHILEQLVDSVPVRIKDIELLTDEEKQEISTFEGTTADYPRNSTIMELFRAQAERSPDHPAIVFEDRMVTYRELATRAAHLSAVLQEQGIRPGDRIGLLADRSIKMMVSIMGILGLGAAYVPLDPSFPSERLTYMLEDSEAKLLIAEAGMRVDGYDGAVLWLSEIDWSSQGIEWSQAGDEYGQVSLSPESAAYVMYTSGSTGKPKGVVTTHRNVVKTSVNNGFMDVQPEDRMLQLSNYAFDGSTYEIFGTLLNGATLYLIEKKHVLDAAELSQVMKRYGITSAFMTAALFNTLVDYDVTSLKHVRKLFFGGEAGSKKHVIKALDYVGPNRIANGYGPTETTVFAATYTVDEDVRAHSSVPIGKPIHNTKVYVLNRWGQRQPVGLPGELYIGGDGLAREYLKQPELTKERFISNPFEQGERLYRTGDLVRWLPDGNLEFMDRLDRQVKIRGNRIELTEVENKLLELPEIKEAVVTAGRDEQGHSFLAAFLVPEEGVEHDKMHRYIRDYLREELPEYMIPTSIALLDKLPLTANGKVDRAALPKPYAYQTNSRITASNETERILVQIWTEILKVENIGIRDHFFELGGHSLKAMMLSGRVQQELQVKLSLQEIFTHDTIEEQALIVHDKKSDMNGRLAIIAAPVQETYPVSSSQWRLYYTQQLLKEGTSYNMPLAFEIKGYLDYGKLQEALSIVTKRHEALQTSYVMIGGELRQSIDPNREADFSIERKSWTKGVEDHSLTQSSIEKYVKSFIRPFDLSSGPLFRAGLLSISETRHVLVLDMHHSISDGISTSIIITELFQQYDGKEVQPKPVLQYKDYAWWEQQYKGSEQYQAEEQYWLKEFSGELPQSSLPYDFNNASTKVPVGAISRLNIDTSLSQQLEDIASAHRTTLFTVLFGAYSILLSKYKQEEDVIIGVPEAGRQLSVTQGMVGMFVNTLPLRLKPIGNLTAVNYLGHVRDQLLTAFDHGSYPLEELLDQLKVSRIHPSQPLFDTLFVLQNMETYSLQSTSLHISQLETVSTQPKFDMTWGAVQTQDGLAVTIEYNANLFSAKTIERMLGHYEHVLEQLVAGNELLIQDIELLTVQEKLEINTFEGTTVDYPRESTIMELFQAQAERSPDHPAIVFEERMVTYRELATRAAHLSAVLQEQGIRPGDRIGLLADRSIEMMVSIMGILGSGAAYVPLDPSFPSDRLTYMLKDSEAKLLIAEAGMRVDGYDGAVLWLSEIDGSSEGLEWSEAGGEYGQVSLSPESAAYVMYTSGSTGRPKGVVTTHRNVVKTSVNNGFMDVQPEDRMLQLSNYAFDGSTYEIFSALLNGATLYLIEKKHVLDAAELSQVMKRYGITSAFMTAALFNTLVDYDVTSLKHVRKLFFGGEAGSKKHVIKALDYVGPNRIANGYGPTETTVFAATYTVDEHVRAHSSVPIGKPIHNTKVYVLNRWGQRQPVGLPGELYIGGDGLAREYLKQPELTKERFISNPFEQGERLYRTGDLVRWLPDGNLEFMDRLDRQVKIRGNRIELTEVENKLLELPEIKEAVVTAGRDEQGHSFLAAFLVPDEGVEHDKMHRYIRDCLREELPEYMIPTSIALLDKLPLTANGKVDRHALPSPVNSMNGERPTNALEANLHKIWCDVLGIDEIGIEDHFFEAGGHSLKAMMLVARIQKEINLPIELQTIFDYPSIKLLAEYLATRSVQSSENYESIKRAPIQEVYRATPYQSYGYLSSLGNTDWNMPTAYLIQGELNLNRLELSFQKLILRHEALRTSFELQGDHVVQRIRSRVRFQLEIEPLGSYSELSQVIKRFIQPFALDSASLLRAKILKLDRDEHILLLDMHHAISDGTSLGIILDELFKLYDGSELKSLELQYKDYSEWQHTKLEQGYFTAASDFWKSYLAGYRPVQLSPLQLEGTRASDHNGSHIRIEISKALIEQMKNSMNIEVTDYTIFYSTYLILLSQLTNEKDLIVGTYAFGRERAEVQEIVGLFINSIPLRYRVNTEDPMTDMFQKVQEMMNLALQHQHYPYEKMLEDLDIPLSPGENPLFNTMFNLNNFMLSALESKERDYCISSYPCEYDYCEYDIYVTAQELEEMYMIQFDYRTAIFEKQFMNKFTKHYMDLLKQIAYDPDTIINQLEHTNISTKAVIH